MLLPEGGSDPFRPFADTVPLPARWHHRCSCCCLDLNTTEDGKIAYINNWRVKLCPFLYVFLLSVTSYIAIVACTFKILHYSVLILYGIICFLFVISYLVTILEGPGFLPYYYPYKAGKGEYHDYISGVALTDEQEQYAKSLHPPPKVGFFHTVGQFVLRPDHFCGWTSQFIGKKNMKTFILFNFWGFIYTSLYLIFFFISFTDLIKLDIVVACLSISFLLIYTFQALLFCIMTLIFFSTSIHNQCVDISQFEIMKSQQDNVEIVPVEGQNCLNLQKAFGPASKWYLWLLPIPAFHWCESDELIPLL